MQRSKLTSQLGAGRSIGYLGGDVRIPYKHEFFSGFLSVRSFLCSDYRLAKKQRPCKLLFPLISPLAARAYERDHNNVYFSNRPHFLWVYRRDNPRGMLGEHEKSFSRVLPTSQVGYHAGKPIESVVYRFYKITLSFL